jgi:hypothetical protein
MPQCDGLSVVKTDYGYRAYDVFRLEDGAWVWCGYGNGRAMLPGYVRKRLAEGRPRVSLLHKTTRKGPKSKRDPRDKKKQERLATPPR